MFSGKILNSGMMYILERQDCEFWRESDFCEDYL